MLNDVTDREIQSFHQLAGNELICEVRKTPSVLYGIFTELVQQFWAGTKEERLFGTPDIQWNKNPDKTDIWIDTELRWEAEHPEFRPAIYVKLGALSYGTVDGNTLGLIRRDIQEGEYHYGRTGSGSVTFVHVGATAGEACSLADATMDYIDAFSPVITDDFCFDWFKLASRVPVQSVEKDSNEKYASAVSYDFRFTDGWVLKLESPKLRSLIVRTSDAVCGRVRHTLDNEFNSPGCKQGIPPELQPGTPNGQYAPIV